MSGFIILLIYIVVFIASFFIVKFAVQTARNDFSSLKTVTFGDESAVTPNRAASVISIATLFVLWASFTGSALIPSFLHAPGAFTGDGSFEYTLEDANGQTDTATVAVRVFGSGEDVKAPEIEPGDGFAKNDSLTIGAYRSKLLIFDNNDEATRKDGAKIVAINGTPVTDGGEVDAGFARVAVTPKGTLNIEPATGWQMEELYLPPPENVWKRVNQTAFEGFRNTGLFEHLGYSLFRVVAGFFFGALVGIPLGYAMGLSNWFRGWFDPIVEFMRPVPPLALIPLVIIWAGIGETGKIILLFLAALWIMAIAARSGVSGVRISKVHAAYSLGASKVQIMRHVIIPNSLPDIFTGARVAMGVCSGTVVAAELVAAERGAGMMIMVASKFQNTDIVLMGIILIGIIGFGIDILMRWAERVLVPWKGKG